ncbi:MAG: RsmE family RNA methyltransferase, partial [Desulfobulbaceae bacterium]|nr:RsmE family RNA methyltransferase [Desulfobulbaceae bacterium]
LGVATIHPYVSQHCSVKERNPNKEQRWQRIALEACKQCKRPTVPECREVSNFDSLLNESADATIKIIFWEQEKSRTLVDLFPAETPPPASVMALFGPEGGFSQEEINQAIKAGFTPISLGNRILRAETAVISGSAILQFLLGNLSNINQ